MSRKAGFPVRAVDVELRGNICDKRVTTVSSKLADQVPQMVVRFLYSVSPVRFELGLVHRAQYTKSTYEVLWLRLLLNDTGFHRVIFD